MMNEEARLAWNIIETTNSHLFLTGRAGTGKTTFLRQLRRESPKRMVVVAPTGIAAINAEGVTIHSFFQLPFAPFVPDATYASQEGKYRFSKQKIRLIRSLDLLVIDEISMVRADLLDAVDSVLRRYRRDSRPFGGVQLVMIGDLGQLAPVAKEEEWTLLGRYYDTPYFFSSLALRRTHYAVVELQQVYRQSDPRFVDLLNRVRDNTADGAVLATLNARCRPDFSPAADEGYIRLTTHNAQAQAINDRELADLPGEAFSYQAEIEGKYPDMLFPTDEVLTLKMGAQVMFVKNDSSSDKRYYNGMIGHVSAIGRNGFSVRPDDGGNEIDVDREEWENSRYVLNEKTKEITEEVDGVFRQYPVKTAWAITIHKSQGLTFDRAIIDAHSAFAHGQTYVALSRCRSLEGLVLSSPLPRNAIIHDRAIDEYSSSSRQLTPDAGMLGTMQREYFRVLVDELFDFSPLLTSLYTLMRLLNEHLGRTYPKLTSEYKARHALATEKIGSVATRFQSQRAQMIAASADYASDAALQERIHKGAAYFLTQVEEIFSLVKKSKVEIANKEVKRRFEEALSTLEEKAGVSRRLLRFFSDHTFSVDAYLHERAMAVLGDDEKPARSRRKTDAPSASASAPAADAGQKVLHQATLDALSLWRKQTAQERGIPSYCVVPQRTLVAVANLRPRSLAELSRIPGLGAARIEKYGGEMLGIIATVKEK